MGQTDMVVKLSMLADEPDGAAEGFRQYLNVRTGDVWH